MEDEAETKKHSKVITFSSPNNRSTTPEKPKNAYQNETKTTKNTFKQQHG